LLLHWGAWHTSRQFGELSHRQEISDNIMKDGRALLKSNSSRPPKEKWIAVLNCIKFCVANEDAALVR
jgi:hypothetical protein